MIVTITYIVVGLLSGSFLLALADRSIDKKYTGKLVQLLTQRSHCDSCKSVISPLHLIPLAGFLVARGRCPHCNEAVSLRYPLSELVASIVSFLVLRFYGVNLESILLLVSLLTILAITYADLKYMKVPDILLVLLIPGAIYSIFRGGFQLDALLGGIVLAAGFVVVLLLFPGGFGGGDIKYAGVLGFYTGLHLVPVLVETALIVGSLCGIAYGLISGKGLRIKMPFAPFISIGYIVAFFWGEDILLFYSSFF